MDGNIYVEIDVPQEYAELLERQAAERGASVDEIVEKAIKNMIERSVEDAGE